MHYSHLNLQSQQAFLTLESIHSLSIIHNIHTCISGSLVYNTTNHQSLQFRYCEKATKFEKINKSFLTLLRTVKKSGRCFQILVAILEYLNFSVIEITRPLALDLPPLPFLGQLLNLNFSKVYTQLCHYYQTTLALDPRYQIYQVYEYVVALEMYHQFMESSIS